MNSIKVFELMPRINSIVSFDCECARGLSSHIKIEYVQFEHEKAMNLISSPSPSTYLPQWRMDGNKRNLDCFYSKKHNSHGHLDA